MLDVAITCIDWLNGQEGLFIWIRSRFSRPEILHQKFTVREAVEVFLGVNKTSAQGEITSLRAVQNFIKKVKTS